MCAPPAVSWVGDGDPMDGISLSGSEVAGGVLLGLDGDITSASTASVMARSANGNITVVTSRGPVRAETLNGDVDARMSSLEGADSVIVKTLNGEAWVFLPEAASIALDVGTTNGSFVTDFPALITAASLKKSVQATLGAGTTGRITSSQSRHCGILLRQCDTILMFIRPSRRQVDPFTCWPESDSPRLPQVGFTLRGTLRLGSLPLARSFSVSLRERRMEQTLDDYGPLGVTPEAGSRL